MPVSRNLSLKKTGGGVTEIILFTGGGGLRLIESRMIEFVRGRGLSIEYYILLVYRH